MNKLKAEQGTFYNMVYNFTEYAFEIELEDDLKLKLK